MPEASRVKVDLPPIPAKRYFTIGEVSDLCAVKPHVLRYWEQEFTQLKPVKRRGNRRYYQHHEVLLIRRIRDLLYEQGFTINGAPPARNGSVGAPHRGARGAHRHHGHPLGRAHRASRRARGHSRAAKAGARQAIIRFRSGRSAAW